MKRLIVAIIAAAMMFAGMNISFAEEIISPASNYTVYAFETGMPTGFNKTGGANTALDEGFSGSNNSLKITLGPNANSSVQIPVYWSVNREYRISFYFKPLDGHTLQTIRPLMYDAGDETGQNKKYDFTEPAVAIENLTSAGNGWYYYSAVYNTGKKPFAAGKGTIELRTTRSNTSDNSAYLIDDLIVEPVKGYSNIIFEENFEDAQEGAKVSAESCQFTEYQDGASVIKKDESDTSINKYVEITGVNGNSSIQSIESFSVEEGKEYKLSFSAKAVANTTDAKIMWHLKNCSYAVNDDAIKLSDTWQNYSKVLDFSRKGSTLYTAVQSIRAQLGSSKAAGGTFALDNIKIEINEIVPCVDKVEVSGAPSVGKELTATLIGGEGLKYIYKVVTVDDNGNEAIAARGTAASNIITYTPKESDEGKSIKFIATAYDDNHDYNTVKSEATVKVENQKTLLRFTSALGETITGEAVQYEYENAIAFMSVFGADGRLIGIKFAAVPKGELTRLSVTLTKTPTKAKLAMFDSIKNLESIAKEVTLSE